MVGCDSKHAQRTTNARSRCLLGDAESTCHLGVGAFLDDAKLKGLTLLGRQRSQGVGECRPRRTQACDVLDPLEVNLGQRAHLDAQSGEAAPLDGATPEVVAQLMTGDTKDPGKRFAVAFATKPRAIRERLRERLADKIHSNIWLQRPPRKEAENVRRVRAVQARDVVRVQAHHLIGD